SCAMPMLPSLDPRDKLLAMRTEDHPLEDLEWEGVIPEGEYGAGPMIVWDRGVFPNISETRRGGPMALAEVRGAGDAAHGPGTGGTGAAYKKLGGRGRGEPMELAEAIEKGDVKLYMLG